MHIVTGAVTSLNNILKCANRAGLEVLHVQLTSQTWHGNLWVHDLQIVRPAEVRNPHSVFLLISGDGDGLSSLSLLRLMAERAGTMAAVLTSVPFQPLYERKEDAQDDLFDLVDGFGPTCDSHLSGQWVVAIPKDKVVKTSRRLRFVQK